MSSSDLLAFPALELGRQIGERDIGGISILKIHCRYLLEVIAGLANHPNEHIMLELPHLRTVAFIGKSDVSWCEF